MHEVNENGQAEEVIEGTVKVGRHGEGCICDELLTDLSATLVLGTCLQYVQDNAEKFAALGLDVPNFLAGKSVTEHPTEAETLIADLVSEGFLAATDLQKALNQPPVYQPPAYAYFDNIDSLDALLDELLAEGELPQLAE